MKSIKVFVGMGIVAASLFCTVSDDAWEPLVVEATLPPWVLTFADYPQKSLLPPPESPMFEHWSDALLLDMEDAPLRLMMRASLAQDRGDHTAAAEMADRAVTAGGHRDLPSVMRTDLKRDFAPISLPEEHLRFMRWYLERPMAETARERREYVRRHRPIVEEARIHAGAIDVLTRLIQDPDATANSVARFRPALHESRRLLNELLSSVRIQDKMVMR